MHPMLNIGIKAAREASRVILQSLNRLDSLHVESKGKNDFVSEIDRQAEAAIIETIRKAYPDHTILAEESGRDQGAQGDSEYEWIIDPLDGTTNFLHGFPIFAISIALRKKGVLEQAVIYDPTRDELFTATRGSGAQLNNRRIRVSGTSQFSHALLATGFPFKSMDYYPCWHKTFEIMMPHVAGIRRAGSAAIDLAQVACGRFDGFWEYDLNPWDIAAGVLLVQEAGGMVSDVSGTQSMLDNGHVIAANPGLYKKLLPIIKEHAKPCS